MTEICALGIDVGSTTTKIVGVSERGDLSWYVLEQTEPRATEQVDRILEGDSSLEALRVIVGHQGQRSDRVPLVATGYGRNLVRQAARSVTEITCHAKGVYRQLGHGGTLVDIGGQDSKVIGIGPAGEVTDFAMNDKCAAGTGRFLENTANRLNIPIEELGQVAISSQDEVSISSTCTIFAESEVISLLAHGTDLGSILKGLHRSLIKRILAMIRTVGLDSPLMLSGGVVLNPAIPSLLEDEAGEKVLIPDHPQLMGAYGAALIALELLHHPSS